MKLIIIFSCLVLEVSCYSDLEEDSWMKQNNDLKDPEDMAAAVRIMNIIITNGFDEDTDNGEIMFGALRELIAYLKLTGNKIFLSDPEVQGFRAVAKEFPEGPTFLKIKYDNDFMRKKFRWSYEELRRMKRQLHEVKINWKKSYRNAFMRKCRLWPEIEI